MSSGQGCCCWRGWAGWFWPVQKSIALRASCHAVEFWPVLSRVYWIEVGKSLTDFGRARWVWPGGFGRAREPVFGCVFRAGLLLLAWLGGGGRACLWPVLGLALAVSVLALSLAYRARSRFLPPRSCLWLIGRASQENCMPRMGASGLVEQPCLPAWLGLV